MPGDIMPFDMTAAVLRQAKIERDRITAILAAIDELKAADAALKVDGLSEAGEYLALNRCTDAEDKLLELILDPGFARYQRSLQGCLTGFLEGAA